MDWSDNKCLLGLVYLSTYIYHRAYFQKVCESLTASFVETRALVRLAYDKALAIVPVAKISVVTTGVKNYGRRSARVVLRARLDYKYLFP